MPIRDFDPSEWNLPPLDVGALPPEPPPERVEFCGVTIGSELGTVAFAGSGLPFDLGAQVHDDLATVRPGLAELGRLGSTDFGALDEVQQVDALLTIERQRAWLDSLQQRLLASISNRDSSDEHWCVEEVGAALRLSGQVAQAKLKNAEQLCDRLPGTLDALADGQIAVLQATAITEASFELDDAQLPYFEARVLRRAPEQSLSQLKQTAKRAVTSLDPASAESKRQRALRDRQVRLTPAEHGMAWLSALLPAADATAAYARIDGAARMAPRTDPRSVDELRADALVNAIFNGIQGELPSAHGRQPRVSVIVALDSLVGKDHEPGWLDGYGAITADYAREIAHDPTGTWRRLLTDPVSGQLLDYGTTSYRPPRHLADLVIARDGQCTFPFCAHSAVNADLDHIDEFPQGHTSAENLQPLHRRHHNSKTHGGWRAERDSTAGSTRWTSPQGRTYSSHPPERWSTPDQPRTGVAADAPRTGIPADPPVAGLATDPPPTDADTSPPDHCDVPPFGQRDGEVSIDTPAVADNSSAGAGPNETHDGADDLAYEEVTTLHLPPSRNCYPADWVAPDPESDEH